MNRETFKKLQASLLFAIAIFVLAAEAAAQKRDGVKPPPAAASLEETREWLVKAIGKYGSYKTRVESVTLSNVRFDGCTLGFTQKRSTDSTSLAVMGATRTRNDVKQDTSFDISKVRVDGISAVDHIYPELRTIQVRTGGVDLTSASGAGLVYEIVVKQDAGDAIRTALTQVQRLCTAKN
ncbi:MAG: hypothetical protein ABIO91_02565 [Pyrinomonadaceae bacterium]